MAFDKSELLTHCARHGRVARVVISKVQGSAPREPGAAMLVWHDGQTGTIGGGALEYDAARAARAALISGQDSQSHHALGPDLGQCCGGAVQLWTEVFDHARATALADDVVVRGNGPMPAALRRSLDRWRAGLEPPRTLLCDGWLAEPAPTPTRHLWVWGAGHVGRALVQVMAPLPAFHITWVDVSADKFPPDPQPQIDRLIAQDPSSLVRFAPAEAQHLIVTHSHSIDLALCHALLGHGFGFAGLIGSATKWARFRKRLAALGHDAHAIGRIQCPIGTPAHGKHPFAIAIGVANGLLGLQHHSAQRLESIA